MDYFSEKYKRIALISFFSFIVVFSLVFIYISITSDKNKNSSQNTSQDKQIYSGKSPTPDFENWTEGEKSSINTAQLNNQSTFYTFKSEYTQQEINKISSTLKVTPELDADDYSVSSQYATNSASLLLFKKADGNLTYISTEGITLSGTKDVPSQILEVVKSLGIYDSSIKITASYKRRSTPGLTYYEIHRDWKEIGYPILNLFGLLNIPENDLLKNLSFTTREENYKDTDIYNSTDLNNAYARKTDFNSMTIIVDENTNAIINIDSNIRPLTITNKVVSKENLLTKQEAIEQLKKGEQSIFLSTPAGSGVIDFAKVYPDNEALAKEAVIEESIIAYLESPLETKETMEPYYIFRGYSELTSGYRIRFIAAVPAQKAVNVAGVFIAASTPGIGGQQQNTLTFPNGSAKTPTPSKVIQPTSKTSATITQAIWSLCHPTTVGNPLAEYEFDGDKYIFAKDSVTDAYSWYLVVDSQKKISGTPMELVDTIRKFLTAIRTFDYGSRGVIFNEQFQIGQRVLNNLLSEIQHFNQITNNDCELRVTGVSPSLFIYGEENSNLRLSINHNVLYSDPELKKTWNIIIKKNNLLVNGQEREYIYYEYETIPFSQPEKGWIIGRNNLNLFVETISSQLKLNNSEKSRLLFELQQASLDIQGNKLFIGLIPQKEIDEKLPLVSSPEVENTYRYHFYMKGMTSKFEVQAPDMQPIKRVEKMIVEFGAINAQ